MPARPIFQKWLKKPKKARDSARRKILSDELATEENLLIEARTNLKQGGSIPD